MYTGLECKMSDVKRVIVWFEQDLRLTDNPALNAAAKSGQPLLPLFVLDESPHDPWPLGGASRWWLHHSLVGLQAQLAARSLPLVIRRGDAATILPDLVKETHATGVFKARRFDAYGRARDDALASHLAELGAPLHRFGGTTLFDPDSIATGSGDRFRVFSPFWRNATKSFEPHRPVPAPDTLTVPSSVPATLPMEALELLPKIDWAGGLAATWVPGVDAARSRLAAVVDEVLPEYAHGRDRPDVEGTSRLSPHLHWGEISPREVWHTVRAAQTRAGGNGFNRQAESFLRELGWREFSHYLLFHYPNLPDTPLNDRFESFRWNANADALKAWQRGETGYPIVDAGMRQLWETGWMHNRVRMVTASFLVKHLLHPWQEGARWFWDTLVDADLANNSASWQWVTGCGVDSAPFFRVFNPVMQGERHDPDGEFVRRYVPELAQLPSMFIHKPWMAPALVLRDAGITLGTTYPMPVIDHTSGRNRALAAFHEVQAETRRRA